MPVDTEQIMKVLSTLAEEERLQVCVKEALKGGLIAGTMAATGGLIGGPIGIAVGATVGGCIATATCKKFSSVVEILSTLQVEQKEVLAQDVRRIMANFGVADLAIFIGMITNNAEIRRRVVETLVNYLSHEMNMAIAAN